MSDQSTSTATDVTAILRNPGLGHVSRVSCSRCIATASDPTGWGLRSYAGGRLLMCQACKKDLDARRTT